MPRTFRIAELALGSCRWDGTYSFNLHSDHFEVQRFGAEFSIPTMKAMIERMRSQVDAFAITSLPTEIRFKDRVYFHRQALEIMSIPSSIPICNGERLKELANINGLSRAIDKGIIRPELGVYFPISLMHLECVHFLIDKYRDSIFFGDLFALGGLPLILQPDDILTKLTKLGLNLANMRDIGKLAPHRDKLLDLVAVGPIRKGLENVRYVFGEPSTLLLLGSDLEFIRGKTVILPYGHREMVDALFQYEPEEIINIFPEEFEEQSIYLNHASLDAALRLSSQRDAPLSIEEWQGLLATKTEVTQATKRYVLGSRPSIQAELTSRLRRLTRAPRRQTPDFAFVIHVLSYEYLYKAPGGGLLKHLPPSWNPEIEKNIARLPGIVYGHASGIVSSKTGREVRGIIYGLFSTPRVMKEEPPEVTYAKIERLCHHAADHGAKIMGLGAYTKVVGDAGATVNRNSPIPVTTGNSLSASATLWALHDAVKRMRLLEVDPETGLVNGTACVIGATGSIGKVSAKLLALAYNRLFIVAPKRERLEELREEIRKIAPLCEIHVATDANEIASEVDVLVTATSAFDQKVIDVERLKPGCVVSDCSRPLDFSLEDAIKRPDILIIESGEVELPGAERQFDCDIGLPGRVVWACLAETSLLAMEGIYEPYTLGREIEIDKVKKIYRLAREHGVTLAAIRGLNGIISDKEIELTRKLALEKRKTWKAS